jgi:hypothetical protein
MKTLVMLLLFIPCAVVAKDKRPIPPYQDGILLEMTESETPGYITPNNGYGSVVVNRHSFTIVIAIGDIAYTGWLGRTYIPNAILNDPIKASVDEKYLYFLTPEKHIPVKAQIIQRKRIGKPPTPQPSAEQPQK